MSVVCDYLFPGMSQWVAVQLNSQSNDTPIREIANRALSHFKLKNLWEIKVYDFPTWGISACIRSIFKCFKRFVLLKKIQSELSQYKPINTQPHEAMEKLASKLKVLKTNRPDLNFDSHKCARFLLAHLNSDKDIRIHKNESPFPKGLHIMKNANVYISVPKGKIGQGGNKKVKKVWDLNKQVWVARITDKFGDYVITKMEVDVMKRLKGKAIQPVLDETFYRKKTGRPSLAIFQPIGLSLWDCIKENKVECDRKKNQIAIDLLVGLTRIHKNGSHGDIKPQNLLIDQNGDANFIDFGSYNPHRAKNYLMAKHVGTSHYLSPDYLLLSSEQLVGLDADETRIKADIWALGVTFHQLFYGTTPPWASYKKSHEEVWASIANLKEPHLDDALLASRPEFEPLIRSMLELDPTKRPSAEDLLERFSSLQPFLLTS